MIFNTWAYYLFFLVPSAIFISFEPAAIPAMGDYCRWQQLLPLFFLHRVRPNYSSGVSWNFSMGIHPRPVLPAEIVVLLGGSSAGGRPAFHF
jgi:hypothetical protein